MTRRISRVVASGVSAAKAKMTARVLAKLTIRLRVGMASSPTPATVSARLPTASHATARCALPSRPDRERATRAGT